MSRLFLVFLLLGLIGTTGLSMAAEPTVAELDWHIKFLETDMARMLAESQKLQLQFNAAQAEVMPLIAERDKRKADEAKAKADAEKATPAK